MKHSESIKEIAIALANAQAQMGGAKKDSTNPHFKSRYADLASVVDAIKGPLSANGISYLQSPLTNEKDECGIQTMLMHTSGEWWVSDPFFVPVSKQDAQGFGSALTYLRRYSLSAATGIAPEDDDGNAAAKESSNGSKRPNTATQVAVDEFARMAPDQQQFIRDQAATIIALAPEAGAKYIEAQHFDDEEKLAIWSQLPSPVRSALKKVARPHMAEQA